MGLSLLAHASVPLKFWDEAFSTTVFLINRLPSKVIDDGTPFERLLGKQPDYTFLRTFGYALFGLILGLTIQGNFSFAPSNVSFSVIVIPTKDSNVWIQKKGVFIYPRM